MGCGGGNREKDKGKEGAYELDENPKLEINNNNNTFILSPYGY